MPLIEHIKNEMSFWYGFNLTYKQVEDYIVSTKLEVFDTMEREDFGNYLAKKITGRHWPMNGDSEKYKSDFYSKLRENAQRMGYIWGEN